MSDHFTRRLLDAIRSRLENGTWSHPCRRITMDVPADVSEQDLLTVRESGFLPRLVLPESGVTRGTIDSISNIDKSCSPP